MSEFVQAVLDMSPVRPTVYSRRRMASDGSIMSTEEVKCLTSRDLSDYDSDSMEIDMDSAYASDPYFENGKPSTDDSLIDLWPTFKPNADNATHKDTTRDISPKIQRGFGKELSNQRTTKEVPPLVSPSPSPSSGVSTREAATPMDLSSPVSAPVSSSSNAGKSTRQRKEVTSSTCSWNRISSPGAHKATGSSRKRIPCTVKGCKMTFFDLSTMRRHVLTEHMKFNPKCPGCGRKYSRDDSLKRHLERSERFSEYCRIAAKACGWVESIRTNGKRKMSKEGRTNRHELIYIAAQGSS